LARTAVVPEAVYVGALSALLRPSSARPSTTAVDPKLPFEVGPTNNRYAPESGLRPNASVARIAFPAERVNPKKRLGHRVEGRLKRRTAHERNAESGAAGVANNASERRNRCRLRRFLACW
jgi:hypothetical protein